nr:uncharacterized protein LOC129415607 [Misgurnus anguillicaudatus]
MNYNWSCIQFFVFLDDSGHIPVSEKKLSKPVPPKYQPLPKTVPQDKVQQMTRTLDLFSDDSLPETSLTNVSPLHQAVSDLLVNEPENTTEEATKNYRTKVLQKLQERELLSMQPRILAAVAPNVDTDEELLDGPCQTLEAFVQFDATLESREKRWGSCLATRHTCLATCHTFTCLPVDPSHLPRYPSHFYMPASRPVTPASLPVTLLRACQSTRHTCLATRHTFTCLPVDPSHLPRYPSHFYVPASVPIQQG